MACYSLTVVIALLLVQKRLKLASKPLAIQGRIGGAKGMVRDHNAPVIACSTFLVCSSPYLPSG
jgi:hypothetical protein